MSKTIRQTRRIMLAIALALPTVAGAATDTFDGFGATNNWTGPWSTGLPTTGTDAFIGVPSSFRNDASSILVIYDYTGAAVTLNSLTLDGQSANPSPRSATLQMSQGSLSSTFEYLGNSMASSNVSIGIINQSGGVNTAAALDLGGPTSSQGTYFLSGSGQVNSALTTVGAAGTGTVFQSGGTLQANSGSGSSFTYATLAVGANTGGYGTFVLSGGNLTVQGGNENIGDAGTGHFIQSGGTHTITDMNLNIASQNGSTGTYELDGGNLNVNNEIIVGGNNYGQGGTGQLLINGGTLTFGTPGVFSSELAVYGNVNNGVTQTDGVITGSQTEVIGPRLNLNYNTSGLVVWNQSGGTNTGGRLIVEGDSVVAGLYLLSSLGTLSMSAEQIGQTGTGEFGFSQPGYFNQSGGGNFVTAGSNSTQGLTVGVGGVYTLSATGELITTGADDLVQGIFNQIAGDHLVGSSLDLSSPNTSTGIYTLSGGTLEVIHNLYVGGSPGGIGGTGQLNISSGSATITGNLVVYPTTGSSVNFSGGSITANNVVVNNNPQFFHWTGGSLTLTGNAEVDVDTFADSWTGPALTLSSGQSLQVSADMVVGNFGSGTVIQNGGNNTLVNGADLYVGSGIGSTGSYTLSGGNLVAPGLFVGVSGQGTFSQSSGATQLADDGLYLGINTGSSGVYNLSGNGALVVSSTEYIAYDGVGVFNQSGGTHNVTGNLYLAVDAGSVGTLTMTGGSTKINLGLYVGGSPGSPGGKGTVNVGGSAVLTVGQYSGGTYPLEIFNSPGNSVNLTTGGTIIAGGLNFNGNPALFNWSGGTLEIVPSVTWDSAAASTSTGAAFGPALTLGSNQALDINNEESIGGTGPFTLTLNSGSSHYVNGGLFINPTGTLTQNPGSTLYANSIVQEGGTINGVLQNQGIFNYISGIFNGRLLNQGQVEFSNTLTLGNGIENDGDLQISTGQTLVSNGQGLDNLGQFNFIGGVLSGNGPAINDYGGTMYAYGTINSSFTNDGRLIVLGTLRFNGGASNNGIIEGDGTVMGSITNVAGGLIEPSDAVDGFSTGGGGGGGGDDPLALISFGGNNAGATIEIDPGYQLNVSNAWTNDGLISMQGTGAVLGGNTITNTGTIAGAGTISAKINNSTGVIRAENGELALGGVGDTNLAGAQIQSATGDTVMFLSGLATNAGTIALSGGAFDNNNKVMTNTGSIEGNGIIRTGGLTNAAAGLILLTDSPSSVYGTVTNSNGANIRIVSSTTTFYGNVVNNGTITVTSGIARFLGNGVSMTVGGTYISDPSDNYFSGLTINNTGSVTGGTGDRFFLLPGTTLNNAGSFNDAGSLSAGVITNSGTFTQTGSITETGNVTNSGTATIGGSQNWSSGTVFTNTAGSATFQTDAGAIAANLAVVTTGGSVTFASTQHLASLNVGSGSTVQITGGGNGHRSTLYTPSLSITGTLDLTANDLDLQGGGPSGLAAVTALIAHSFTNGRWTGTGIASSAAAGDNTHLTTVGVILNIAYTTLDGAPVAINDVLAKETYFGDADLSGKVDSADYTRIDNGYLTHATGWSNGDFNYDNVINGSDYTLIDNAFNTQGAQLLSEVSAPSADSAAQIAGISAVPEPTGLIAVSFAALAMLSRRRMDGRISRLMLHDARMNNLMAQPPVRFSSVS